MTLKEKYDSLLKKYNIDSTAEYVNVFSKVKWLLEKFVGECNTPAVWCLGHHTKMLMSDFIFELKKVKYIIDKNPNINTDKGFQVISADEISKYNIDGIIISSYVYRKEIVNTIKEKYPNIKYIDIYAEIEKDGISLSSEYFNINHPYSHYANINKLVRKMSSCKSNLEKIDLYRELVMIYIKIKDFKSAITCVKEWLGIDKCDCTEQLLIELEDIYKAELKAAYEINENNVLMLCFDGLRCKDIKNGDMPEIKKYIDGNMMFYTNAYSISTSTYESLIPAYTENYDMQTKYYEMNTVSEDNCRFIAGAAAQNRDIHFYINNIKFESDNVNCVDYAQCAAEKLWDFIADAENTDNGLFYIHILYESHFSYVNPYTVQPLICQGTTIFFDYLSDKSLKTDYTMQHCDALRYLDDIVSPILKQLKCNVLLYADHGNIIYDGNKQFDEINYTELTFNENLIHIPLAIKSSIQKSCENNNLCSISELNNIISCLMNKEEVIISEREYVKIMRSSIYNPDFNFIYRKLGFDRGLQAFEGFIFNNGYKLIVYSDGSTDLYSVEDDEKICDDNLKSSLFERIKADITLI